MATQNPAIFTNQATRLWIQNGGIGTAFGLYACHALPSWSQSFGETTYIKCKSPDAYGKKIIKESIPGDPDQPTFTVTAYTAREADFLVGITCEMDFQVFFGSCTSPSDPTGYTKIRHFYRAARTQIGEDNIDFLGDEDYDGVVLTAEFTAEEVIEILKCTVTSSANGVTEAQAFNDIAFVREARCEGDCGAEIKACYWGVAVADANYGAATANVWYTSDGGATWTVCATDPFSENGANISSCVILVGETAPRFIVFRGTVSGSYGSRCSISDDWGASWSEVTIGGNTNGSYVNGAFAYSAGLIYAVGNGGYIWYSEDRGSNWTEILPATTGVAVELWDTHTSDGVTIYAVGDSNTVIKSTDSGVSWASTTTSPADGTEALFTVQAPTEYRVIVGGEIDAGEDCLWISQDGGATWSDVDFTGSTTADGQVRRLRMTPHAPAQHWAFVHGANNGATMRYGPGTNFRVYRTLDGGGSMERMSLVTNSGLNSIAVCSINLAHACGEPQGGVAVIQKMATS